MVAIDAKTGKYRWHFQQVHHDIWDYDAPNPVMLFDVKINGKPRKGVARGRARPAGSTSSIARPASRSIGIDEKPVLQEPQQAHVADAAVSPRRCLRPAVRSTSRRKDTSS